MHLFTEGRSLVIGELEALGSLGQVSMSGDREPDLPSQRRQLSQ